ncbi:MAG: hypothetical protein Q4B96_00030 [Bacillota bacterium]|nr:hypothetical protein [Bacillota bacterium]
MFMQKIRKSTRKHRKLLIGVIILLMIGLVGSFAVWGSNDYSGGESVEDMTTVERIAAYEQYIDEIKADAGEEMDYSTATTLASLHMTMYSLNYTAASENSSNAEAAASYSVQAQVEASTAADYYQQALELAPDTLNDLGKAQLIAGQAEAVFYSGDAAAAEQLYIQATDLAPDDLDTNIKYANYLYSVNGLDAAVAYLTVLRGRVSADESKVAAVDAQIEYIQGMDEFYAMLGQDSDTDASADEAAEGTDEAATENTDEATE